MEWSCVQVATTTGSSIEDQHYDNAKARNKVS